MHLLNLLLTTNSFLNKREPHLEYSTLACCDGHVPTWQAPLDGEFPEVGLMGAHSNPSFMGSLGSLCAVFMF